MRGTGPSYSSENILHSGSIRYRQALRKVTDTMTGPSSDRDQLLQQAVLLPEAASSGGPGPSPSRRTAFPAAKGVLANPNLPDQLCHWHAQLRLLQYCHDLLHRKALALHANLFSDVAED